MHSCRPVRGADAIRFAVGILAAATLHLSAHAQTNDEMRPSGAPSAAGALLDDALLAQNLEIPPVIERPLGNEGPRVRVIEFELDGVSYREDRDITEDGVDTILNTHLATQPFEGFTIGDLQVIADDVTNYYRGRGMMLARAFVPVQTVEDGVVKLQVVEGALASVAVEGNERYETDSILGPFGDLVTEPVDQGTVEEALLTLQEFPGLTVFGTFREGGTLGETELLVRVRDERPRYFTLGVDNYGSQYTGDWRAILQFGFQGIGGSPNSLEGYLLQTTSPSNGTYGGVEYSTTLRRAKNTLGFGVSKNQYDVTDSSNNIDLRLAGEVEQMNFFVAHSIANRRGFRADSTFDLARKDSVIRQVGISPEDELLVFSYTYDYYAVARGQRGINLGFFRGVYGDNTGELPSRRGASGATGEGTYSKLEFGYQRLQRFGDHQALLLRLDGQQSDDLLVNLEQFAIGGPANVRAYPVAEGLIDTGGSATLEWIVDAPGFADRPTRNRTWGELFQFSTYFDWAGGELNDPLSSQEETVNFRGYGVGFQFGVPDKFYLRLDIAQPDSGGPEPTNGKDPQYYFSFNYTF